MHKQNTHILFFTQAHSVMIWPGNWKQDFIHWAWNCFHRAWKVNCFNLKNISGNWRKYKVGLVEQRLVWPRLQVFTLFTILSLAKKITSFFAQFTIYTLGKSDWHLKIYEYTFIFQSIFYNSKWSFEKPTKIFFSSASPGSPLLSPVQYSIIYQYHHHRIIKPPISSIFINHLTPSSIKLIQCSPPKKVPVDLLKCSFVHCSSPHSSVDTLTSRWRLNWRRTHLEIFSYSINEKQ